LDINASVMPLRSTYQTWFKPNWV